MYICILGEGDDGLTCVRFGMVSILFFFSYPGRVSLIHYLICYNHYYQVTEDTDVNELLELVIDAGQAIQEDSKVLDSMSEMVKKGMNFYLKNFPSINVQHIYMIWVIF